MVMAYLFMKTAGATPENLRAALFMEMECLPLPMEISTRVSLKKVILMERVF